MVHGMSPRTSPHWRESATVSTTSWEAPLGTDPDAGKVADLIPDENALMPWVGSGG